MTKLNILLIFLTLSFSGCWWANEFSQDCVPSTCAGTCQDNFCVLLPGDTTGADTGTSDSDMDFATCTEDIECVDEDFSCNTVTNLCVDTSAKFKFAMVLPGSPAEGWSQGHDDARKAVTAKLNNVESTSIPSTFLPNAIEEGINTFVADGNQLIIGASQGHLSKMQAGALANPDVDFIVVGGFQTGANLGSYFGRIYQAVYQAGFVAGQRLLVNMNSTNKIGIVVPLVLPELVRHVNAFTQGARDANPDAQIMVEWTESWKNPALEIEKTDILVAAGAEIIFAHNDTSAIVEHVDTLPNTENGTKILSVGYNSKEVCESAQGRRSCLTSVYWNWEPTLEKIIHDIRVGQWDASPKIWEQIKGDKELSMFSITSINKSLSTAVERDKANELLGLHLIADTEKARMYPFRGPVVDSKNTTRIAGARYPSDNDLFEMCWFVKGVVETSELPTPPGGTVPDGTGGGPSACVGQR